MEKSIKLDGITLGVCYYPEQWPEDLWEDDLRRMSEYGIQYIRVGEFAWNKFEPEEGKYTFDFFDRFFEIVRKFNRKVILGTPTATPPVWLTEKYPEALNARPDGILYRHGMRRHYNYNSLIYRKFCSSIVEKLAAHYCKNPVIAGWQIDNEINCEIDEFHSESDQKAFRKFLQKKYGTLEKLNKAWGTTFWNQTYTDWEQVHLSRPTPRNVQNPHFALDEKRFFSESAISFCKMQADMIRKYAPQGQFITTNGIFGNLDSHKMTDSALDFFTYDSYPNFAYEISSKTNMKDRKWSGNLSIIRSISPNFGIMEQQAGPGGGTSGGIQSSPKPGQMRLWTFQSIAHGADFISYFRWRTSVIGTEIYWHGLFNYDNCTNRRVEELKRIRSDLEKISSFAGSRYAAHVAVLRDYDNIWDSEADRWHGTLASFSERNLFETLQHTHTPFDYIYLDEENSDEKLFHYELIFCPHAAILSQRTANLLESYVRHGGKLVFGARTGYKDENGHGRMMPTPGFAGKLCGIRVKDFTFLRPEEKMTADWGGHPMEMPLFNEILEVSDPAVEVLARYEEGYYAGEAALTERREGSGEIFYLGAAFNEQNVRMLLKRLGHSEPYRELLEMPEECELAIREKDDRKLFFLLNYEPEEKIITLKQSADEVLSGKLLSGEIKIDKYGVLILLLN